MSWVTILWSMGAAVSLTLAMLHAVVWWWRREARANLMFVLAALSMAAIAVCELRLMRSSDPDTFGTVMRWSHVPILVLHVGLFGFVSSYLGTGIRWLGWFSVVLRLLSLLPNFLTGVNVHYQSIVSLQQVSLLGEKVWVVDEAIVSRWSHLAEAATLLLLVFVIHDSFVLWLKGGREMRRRAVVIGGSFAFFIVSAAGLAALTRYGFYDGPHLISFSFLSIVAAMGWELTREVIRAARLSEELEETTDSMRLAASAAKLALWRWDLARDVIWITSNGRSLYGVNEDVEIDIRSFFNTLHPEDREMTHTLIEKAISGDGQFEATYRVVHLDGTLRWIEARGKVDFHSGSHQPVRMRGVSMDVTERKQLQNRFRLIVEAAPSGVVLSDPEGRIILANARAERELGYEAGGLVGQSIETLVPERYRRAHSELRNGFQAVPSVRMMGAGRELMAVRRDGSEFPVEVALSPVESEGGMLVLSVITDITARRAFENQVRELRAEIAHITRVATLGELSGSLAHELNQPLASILSNAEAAQRFLSQNPPDLSELGDILTDIISEDLRASEVINRLRAMVKRDAMELAPVGINAAVEEVCSLVKSDLAVRGVHLSLDLNPACPLTLADRVQIQQVLLNLVLNAADAVAEEPAGARQIVISTRHHENWVGAEVRDTGHGLPNDLEPLFKPFFTTKIHGLGMGLAICKTIVESHHGRLSAQSHPGKGAIFHFELPVATTTVP